MAARKYRLIAVAVEALQVLPETVAEAALWCGGLQVEEIDPHDGSKRFVGINVATRTGMQRASQGSYIVKSLANNFSVLEAHEFESQYEEA